MHHVVVVPVVFSPWTIDQMRAKLSRHTFSIELHDHATLHQQWTKNTSDMAAAAGATAAGSAAAAGAQASMEMVSKAFTVRPMEIKFPDTKGHVRSVTFPQLTLPQTLGVVQEGDGAAAAAVAAWRTEFNAAEEMMVRFCMDVRRQDPFGPCPHVPIRIPETRFMQLYNTQVSDSYKNEQHHSSKSSSFGIGLGHSGLGLGIASNKVRVEKAKRMNVLQSFRCCIFDVALCCQCDEFHALVYLNLQSIRVCPLSELQ